MMKKSTANRLKSLIYPLAFILIVILSAVYKFVFKGSGDLSVQAYKSRKTSQITESSEVLTDASAAGSASSEQSTATVQLISVYICGEVKNPGIYEAPKGVMLNDIIEYAGGLTDAASESNINLVYQIEYNMSIYIPSEEEITGGFSGGDIIRQDGVYVWGSGQSGGTGQSTVFMVNINTATKEELKSLPGIGEVTAKAIVDYRKENPFKTIDDIKNVSGIGDSKFKQIKDYICV